MEKAGESVQPVQAGEADMSQSGALRETYGLRQQSLTEKQRSVQRERADKNAGKAGTITKAVNAVKQLLSSIISKAKEILTIDPENRAALHAKKLAEAQKKALQDAYFAHAEKAMDNLRAAKENAAAIEGNGAAKGVRFQLAEGEETLEKQLNEHLKQLDRMEPVATITGNEVAYGATNKENAENIVRYFESIGGKVERDGFGVVELSRKGAKATVQHGNGPVKQIAAAAIPDVIRYGEQIGTTENWKERGYNTHTFVAPVTVGETTIYEAVIVNEYRSTKQGNKFYVHEVCGSDGSMLVLDNEGHIKQKQESADTVFKTEEGGERPGFPAKTSIAQDAGENNAAVQKTVRFALSAPVEVDGQKELVAVHNLTEQNLREALQLGGMPSPSIAVVKAREGHTKYGPVSLVFGSDTIDPMVDKANRVYGADAWTPTRPGVEYEVHADKARALNTTLAQLSRQTAGGEFARGNVITGTMDMEVSRKSPQQIAEELAHSDAVKAAYLAAQGEDVDVVTKQEQRFTEEQKARSERIIEAVGGEDVLRDIVETDAKNGNHDKANAVLQAVKEAEEVNRLIPPKLYLWLKRAYKYLDAGNEPAKMVKDTDAMRQALQQKAPDAKVEQWLLPQVEKTLGRKGIYNGKEIYTRNGNRRSFAQLHNPYTLENLVNAMNQEQARGKGAWGLSARTLLSTAGNFLFGSELYSAVDNAMSGKDYDVVSATNISAVNDLMSDVTKWFAEWRRDTSGMTEAQLAAHEDRLHTRTFNLIEDGMEIAGVPYGNGRKLVDAVQGYWDDIQTVARGGKFSFNALREEGDPSESFRTQRSEPFLSTPSARRATNNPAEGLIQLRISIHALREEGDQCTLVYGGGFYISIHALREEGDERMLRV